MKKLWLIVGLVGVLWATTAQATLQLSASRTPGYYSGGGGEFTLTPNAALAAQLVVGTYSDISSPPGTFQSFCLETGETIGNGVTADVVINSKAVNGGVGPGGDPISVGTSWLYSQFRLGSLTGYNYTPGITTRQPDADILQQTIWYLEGEQLSAPSDLKFLNIVTTKYSTLAGAEADAAPYENGVVALNLWAPGKIGSTNPADRWQDQLALVPEPTTMIAGALLLLPFGASTLRILRKNRAA